jgi:hypothetical protein
MTRLELAPPRHVPPRPGDPCGSWAPWLELSLLVRASVPEWGHVESAWFHRAFAVGPDGSPAGEGVPFDPAARAALPGEPQGTLDVRRPAAVTEGAARAVVADALATWRPALHRHLELGAVSRLDEPAGEFRRRCLAPLRALVQAGGGGAAAAELAARLEALARGIETARLDSGSLDVQSARVAVVWYPTGSGPQPPASDPMVAGDARERR